MPSLSKDLRPTPVGWGYALAVAGVATYGFTTGSTAAILLAAAATLPMSVIALPAYYVVYGLLAQVPGANPSTSTSAVSCAADGECVGSTAGDVAAWFSITTDTLGILALTTAAVLNVVVVRGLSAARRKQVRARAVPSA